VATQADTLLAELAVKNHLITPAEAQACLAELQPGQELGQLLVEKRMLKERHLKSLTKKLNKILEERGAPAVVAADPREAVTLIEPAPPATSPTDATFVTGGQGLAPMLTEGALVLFGQIAVKFNYVTEHNLERALRLQEHLAAQNNPMRIGEILVKARQLTPDQVHQVLQFQDTWVYRCGACHRRFNVSGSQEAANALRCSACGGALGRSSGTSISVAGTHAPMGTSGELAPMSSLSNTLQTSQGTSERKSPTAEDPAGILGLDWSPNPHTTFHVDKVLGRGGMGAVYLATHRDTGRRVALKVMLRGGNEASQDERERFEREAKLVAGHLNHPGIVKVYDAAWDAELCWFTMELVDGMDFKKTLRTGKFPMRKGAEVVAKVARAMDFAHKKGIIHRDLKPQNIMIDDESGEPKVLDFGLAKNIDATSMEQLTQMGAFLGTPAYMAPEQAGGDPNAIDHRADVYALGAILYEVLTGTPPFTGKKAIQVIRKVLREDPKPCREVFPQAPPDLEAVAMQALRKEPSERQQSAGQLADEIEAVIGKVTRSHGPASSAKADDQSKSDKKGFLGRFLGG
jgi:serine/threonine protein kinase/DNA-directed RNA polymerase subunit RPC12/RpoP